MPRACDIYLDIETSFDGLITVIGIFSRPTGLVQLFGSEVTAQRLGAVLPPSGTIYTYNGHCFDLPFITRELDLNLRERFASIDLRFVCQRNRLTGGQKVVEQRIGVKRKLPEMDGRDALWLWEQYLNGDEGALKTLLLYNAEDVYGLRAIKRHCSKQRMI